MATVLACVLSKSLYGMSFYLLDLLLTFNFNLVIFSDPLDYIMLARYVYACISKLFLVFYRKLENTVNTTLDI